jgi:hypothetical protein
MTDAVSTKDLIVLAADKNIEYALRGLLSRPADLQLRPISTETFVHPERDPGCLRRSDDFLRAWCRQYDHALVIFDREGCGEQVRGAQKLEKLVEGKLSRSGWSDRAAAIVLDPELEIWVWSESPHVDAVLGWRGKTPNLRQWLKQQGLLGDRDVKPRRPKEAMEKALKTVRLPRSSSLYLELAQAVAFEQCVDRAFLKFRDTLRNWFHL